MRGVEVILIIEDVWGGPPRRVRFPDAPTEGGSRRLTIGRSADCDIALDDPGRTLSRRHLELDRRADGLTVTDVSLLGSWLGGARMPAELPLPLDHGDVIDFSHFRISIQVAGGDSVDALLAELETVPDAPPPARARRPARPAAAPPPPAPPQAPTAAGGDAADEVDLDALLNKEFVRRGD
ncbi:FHA domain-containing protein [Rubrimonas cliftonensis]|uniref:FHA domain-containing protein n=2 Tax=Rubrimonas cliftonensis TaxID=89524 RepID=A0A1H4FAT0_9RHOB|nr:FHA domain-containing protein [Rubrimonas cliftonensis]